MGVSCSTQVRCASADHLTAACRCAGGDRCDCDHQVRSKDRADRADRAARHDGCRLQRKRAAAAGASGSASDACNVAAIEQRQLDDHLDGAGSGSRRLPAVARPQAFSDRHCDTCAAAPVIFCRRDPTPVQRAPLARAAGQPSRRFPRATTFPGRSGRLGGQLVSGDEWCCRLPRARPGSTHPASGSPLVVPASARPGVLYRRRRRSCSAGCAGTLAAGKCELRRRRGALRRGVGKAATARRGPGRGARLRLCRWLHDRDRHVVDACPTGSGLGAHFSSGVLRRFTRPRSGGCGPLDRVRQQGRRVRPLDRSCADGAHRGSTRASCHPPRLRADLKVLVSAGARSKRCRPTSAGAPSHQDPDTSQAAAGSKPV